MQKKFQALADDLRLRILGLLQDGELCVCDLVKVLEMGQSKVSFHMGILKEAGLVKDRPDSKWVHYSLNNQDEFCRQFLPWILKNLDGSSQFLEDCEVLQAVLAQKKLKKTTKGKAGAVKC